MPRPTAERKRRSGGRERLPGYLRRRSWWRSRTAGLVERGGALLLLAAVIVHGLELGGHVKDPTSPFYNLEGRLAGLFGMQAERIAIAGLKYHRPETVLRAIGIRSGGSMLMFDPDQARRLLENLDWVKKARVEKVYPNALRIRITEREPIALWQTDGAFYPVDEEGVAIVSLHPGRFSRLLLVTGEGANTAAATLVNRLEARKALRSQVRAAARVGKRRWNLYLASGLKVLLPEKDEERALDALAAMLADGRLNEKAVAVLDMRLEERLFLRPQRLAAAAGGE
jgi:cell division protein FtsQ